MVIVTEPNPVQPRTAVPPLGQLPAALPLSAEKLSIPSALKLEDPRPNWKPLTIEVIRDGIAPMALPATETRPATDFARSPGVLTLVGLGDGEIVGVGDNTGAVGDIDAVGDGESVGDMVAVGDGDVVGDTDAVGDSVSVGDTDVVGDTVAVGDTVIVGDGDSVDVGVGVAEGVTVIVSVGVGVTHPSRAAFTLSVSSSTVTR